MALRWQSKVAEIAHKTLLTVDSAIAAQITPTVIKYTSKFHYEIVQGNAAQLTLALPASQSLTRLEGEQIRDWHTAADGDRQTLTVEFIKPVENACDLTLYSEQAVDGGTGSSLSIVRTRSPERQDVCSTLNPPQPLNVERESGSLTVSAEDTLVETIALTGLRQVNATEIRWRRISSIHGHSRSRSGSSTSSRSSACTTVSVRGSRKRGSSSRTTSR